MEKFRKSTSAKVMGKSIEVHFFDSQCMYKLQNGAIPLILELGKIRNTRFVVNLILNIQKKRNFLMTTSLL